MAAQPDPRILSSVTQLDPAPFWSVFSLAKSYPTLLSLFMQQDSTLLAPFESVLGMDWQPDPIAFSRGDNAPSRNSWKKKTQQNNTPRGSTIFISQIILFLILILLIIVKIIIFITRIILFFILILLIIVKVIIFKTQIILFLLLLLLIILNIIIFITQIIYFLYWYF